METTTKERTRKPRARQRDVIIGCIEERLSMLALGENTDHVSRLYELFDELKRSLNGKGGDDE